MSFVKQVKYMDGKIFIPICYAIVGYKIIQNPNLCELWEVPNFEGFEILTGCKQPELVKL